MFAIYRTFESSGDELYVLTHRGNSWIKYSDRNHYLFIGTVDTYDDEAAAAPMLETQTAAAYLEAFAYR